MKSWLLKVGIVCFCILVAGGISIKYFIDLEPPFILSIDHPADIYVGDDIEMDFSVENTTKTDHNLSYINFGDVFLKHFQLISYQPYGVEQIDDDGFLTFYIDETIKGGSSYDLTIRVRPIKPGQSQMGVDVDCSELGLVSYPHKWVVTEAK